MSDFLLEELDRRREGHMRDIVATIQSDQYRLITAEPDGALVVQGGPGTGKTAVGLHRASWLLYTHREQLRRVLVVGPNPMFMDYVAHVLPALGEDAVEQRAVTELLDGVVVEREEAPDVARLKADTRLADVVARAVELAVRPAPEELVFYVDGVFVSVREREVRELLDELIESGMALGPARERFRMAVLRRFNERYNEKLEDLGLRSFDELERALKHGGFLAKYVGRVLPAVRSDKLVARLLTSPSALAEAAEGILDRAEQKLLLRDRPRRAGELRWSEHDLPLLDEARALLDGPPRAYGHVIVDEAQDLSPMQLRAISRRALGGSLTILGDVAQAKGLSSTAAGASSCRTCRRAWTSPSKSCGTPIESPRRSWSSRCRCWRRSHRTSSRRSRTVRAAPRRCSSRSRPATCWRRRCERRRRLPSSTG